MALEPINSDGRAVFTINGGDLDAVDCENAVNFIGEEIKNSKSLKAIIGDFNSYLTIIEN